MRRAFTILELLIVLAIIAIMAAIAVSSVFRSQPKDRLVGDTRELLMVLQRARMEAVRDYRLVKVCLFRDSNPGDAIPGAYYAMLECNDSGPTGCAGSPSACANVQSDGSAGPFLLGTAVDATNALTCAQPGGPSTPGRWCAINAVDLTKLFHAPDHVSISTFLQADKTTPVAVNALEVTYGVTGTVVAAPYSTQQAGFVATSNYDQCLPSLPPGTCSSFVNRFYVQYTLGGAFRLTD